MIRLTLVLAAALLGVMLMHDPKSPAPPRADIAVSTLPEVAAETPTPRPAPETVAEKPAQASTLLSVAAKDAPPEATRATADPVALPAVLQTNDAPPRMLMVTGSRVNLRAGPSTSAGVIGKLTRGETAVLIREAAEGWSEVRHPETGATGFMSSEYLQPLAGTDG